ncbi:MAG: hypothetical protein Q8M16_00110 [Pirellulaceae bacterium]|nr:hypothetical protein [Pirellulaceae bacterium]
MQDLFRYFNARFDRLPFLFYSLLMFSLDCDTSLGQASDIAANIEILTKKIDQNGNDANLFLERAKLYLELSEHQRSEEFTSELAFPIVRAGVEANELAIQDSSSAIARNPEFCDAYFLRARIRIRHPDSMDYGKWSMLYKHFDPVPYQEYGESPSPENAKRMFHDLILPDLNAGLKWQPDSKQGQDDRMFVLRVLGKGDQVLNEVNQMLQKSDITQERRTELLRIRLSIFNWEKIGDADQANEDEAAIKVYEEAMRQEEFKTFAESSIIQLTDRLGSVDLSSNERAELLSSRAEFGTPIVETPRQLLRQDKPEGIGSGRSRPCEENP